MNTAVKTVEDLLAQFANDAKQAAQLIKLALENKDSFLVKAITLADRDLRWSIEQNRESSLKLHLTNSMRHAAWSAYFDLIDFSKCVSSDIYWKAIKNYLYDDFEKRHFSSGVTELKDFTVENIEEFKNNFLAPNEELMQKAVKNLLYRTGDWRKRNKEYKTRQTFVGKVCGGLNPCADGTFAGELAEVLQAINHYKGVEMSANFLGEMRKELTTYDKEYNTEYTLMDGVSYTLKSSLSLELRLDKSIVALLNSKLPATV